MNAWNAQQRRQSPYVECAASPSLGGTTARDMAKSYYQYFNHLSKIMVSKAKCLHKRALHLVKTAKWEYYLKLTKEVDTRNMWDFCKWTGGKCTYTSPALSSGDGQDPVSQPTANSNLLRTPL